MKSTSIQYQIFSHIFLIFSSLLLKLMKYNIFPWSAHPRHIVSFPVNFLYFPFVLVARSTIHIYSRYVIYLVCSTFTQTCTDQNYYYCCTYNSYTYIRCSLPYGTTDTQRDESLDVAATLAHPHHILLRDMYYNNFLARHLFVVFVCNIFALVCVVLRFFSLHIVVVYPFY